MLEIPCSLLQSDIHKVAHAYTHPHYLLYARNNSWKVLRVWQTYRENKCHSPFFGYSLKRVFVCVWMCACVCACVRVLRYTTTSICLPENLRIKKKNVSPFCQLKKILSLCWGLLAKEGFDMHYTQTYTQSPQTAIPCYVWIVCIPFPSGMVYHTASDAGLNQSVATSQILTAMLRKWQMNSKWEATRTKLLMLQWWK